MFSNFSALPQNSLRSSAAESPKPFTVLMVGAIGPNGVSVANTTLSAPKNSKPQRVAGTPPPNMAVSP